MDPITATPNPLDLLRQMREHGAAVYRAAYERGMSLEAYLEEVDPSSNYPGTRTDAFGRLLQAAGIRTRSDLRRGIYASTYEDFVKHPEARALVPEWWARTWRRTQHAAMQYRSQWDYSDNTPGSWARPYVDEEMVLSSQQIAPAIPLAEIVAITIPIERPDYRAHYLTFDEDQVRQPRVEAGTEVPLAKLSSGDRTITAKKYGRALEATYEQLQFQRMDEIALTIQLMAVQAEKDKVVDGMDIIINGDGNSGTAATSHDLTTLDTAASAGTLTLNGWLSFNFQFEAPYMLTTVLVQNAVALQLLTLNVGNANTPMLFMLNQPGFTAFRSINSTADNVALGRTSSAPALKIVGFDRNWSLKRLTVIGANIEEVERFTRNQTEVLTMTEMEAFAILDANAAKVLDINA